MKFTEKYHINEIQSIIKVFFGKKFVVLYELTLLTSEMVGLTRLEPLKITLV